MEPAGDSLAQVAACVHRFRSDAKEHTELELRLGTYTDGQFCPGVSKDVFYDLERDLQDAAVLVADPGWMEHTDFHYTTARNETARTRVEYDTENIEVNTTHTIKTTHQNVIFRRTDGGDEAFRIAVAAETPLLDPPGSCLPTHVRIKQRKRFVDIRNGSAVWSYELSKTWSACSRNAVEHKQHTTEPAYEVECELADRGRAYVAQHSDEQIARSLLMKGNLLLGEDPDTVLEMCDASGAGRVATKRAKPRCRRQN